MQTDSNGIYLITRGDDGATSRSANLAMRFAFEQGILRNVSVNATGEALQHAYEVFGRLDGLCIGLHLSLTGEWIGAPWRPVLPVDKVPSIVTKDGVLPATTKEYWQMNPWIEELLAETKAQLDLLRATGFDVRYMDGHMGVGTLPSMKEALPAFLRKEGLLDLTQIRYTPWPKLDGEPAEPHRRMAAHLKVIQPGTYIRVGHPCLPGQDIRPLYYDGSKPGEVARQREMEMQMFTDWDVIDVCRERGVVPCRFSDLAS